MEVSTKRLKELERTEAKMAALDAGGVDNWEWYGDALKDWFNENEHEENINSLIKDLETTFGECAYEPSERGAGIAFRDDIYDDVTEVLKAHKVNFK